MYTLLSRAIGYLKTYWVAAASLGIFGAFVLITIVIFSIPPADFPQRDIVSIKKDYTLSQAADALSQNNIVKSRSLYKIFVVLLGGEKKVIAGDYLFDKPQSALRVAYRTVYGVQGLQKIKVTIPEGSSSLGIAWILGKSIPGFDSAKFLSMAKPYEGYLFPDTYFFYENTKPEDALALMRDTFNEKIHDVLPDIKSFGHPLSEIVIMSSIVEREATSSADRRIISGILWRRMEAGIPLQVDAALFYVLRKDSSELTRSDLATSSPYNLYKYKGLTPTPIDNPGIEAIEDTIAPTPTDYVFFLSGKDGRTHYAATLDEHAANKRKYLE